MLPSLCPEELLVHSTAQIIDRSLVSSNSYLRGWTGQSGIGGSIFVMSFHIRHWSNKIIKPFCMKNLQLLLTKSFFPQLLLICCPGVVESIDFVCRLTDEHLHRTTSELETDHLV